MSEVKWVVRTRHAGGEPIGQGPDISNALKTEVGLFGVGETPPSGGRARSGKEELEDLLTTPLEDVIGGLVKQASKAAPASAKCEVEVSGKITRTFTGEAKAGVKPWVFEISLGGTGTKSSENDFRLMFSFQTPNK